jgi:hypothetical protein
METPEINWEEVMNFETPAVEQSIGLWIEPILGQLQWILNDTKVTDFFNHQTYTPINMRFRIYANYINDDHEIKDRITELDNYGEDIYNALIHYGYHININDVDLAKSIINYIIIRYLSLSSD